MNIFFILNYISLNTYNIYIIFVYRYYGVNDPVAEKLMRRASAMPKLEPPEDKSITTLYVGNLGERISEKELR